MTNEERINKWLTVWKSRLLLDHYAIIVALADKDKPSNVEGLNTLAEIVVNSRYNEARLTLFPLFFRESKVNQQCSLVHELCHIHTDGIEQLLNQAIRKGSVKEKDKLDVWEKLTEEFAKVVFRAYNKSKQTIKYHI